MGCSFISSSTIKQISRWNGCVEGYTQKKSHPLSVHDLQIMSNLGAFLRPAGSMALNWITDPVEHKRSCAEKEHIFCGIYSATFSVLRAWLLCFSKYIAGVLLKSSVPALSSTLTYFHKRHLICLRCRSEDRHKRGAHFSTQAHYHLPTQTAVDYEWHSRLLLRRETHYRMLNTAVQRASQC